MSAQFKVGQQVGGSDYDRLPVGTQALYEGAPAPIVKGADGWTYYGEPMDPENLRTITHLPDAAEPEDKDDLYVEPEPLKNGEWTQAWVRVVDAKVTDDGEIAACLPRMEDGYRYFGGVVHIAEDALIRTDEDPPWVKSERCTSLLMIDKTTNLRQCTRLSDPHDNHVANGACWRDDEAYGRVEVSS